MRWLRDGKDKRNIVVAFIPKYGICKATSWTFRFPDPRTSQSAMLQMEANRSNIFSKVTYPVKSVHPTSAVFAVGLLSLLIPPLLPPLPAPGL